MRKYWLREKQTNRPPWEQRPSDCRGEFMSVTSMGISRDLRAHETKEESMAAQTDSKARANVPDIGPSFI